MKLTQLAREPQLIQVVIDDADIVQEYGETVEFWTWDRQPMDAFMKLAAVNPDETHTVITAVRDLVLDEHGQRVLTDTTVLPTRLMLRVIARVVDGLGK
jgi:hypothetical protein